MVLMGKYNGAVSPVADSKLVSLYCVVNVTIYDSMYVLSRHIVPCSLYKMMYKKGDLKFIVPYALFR